MIPYTLICIFGMIQFYLKGNIISFIIIISMLILKIIILFTDKINKYLPIKIMTRKNHKKMQYYLIIIIVIILRLIYTITGF